MRFTDMADEMFGAAQGALPAGVRLATAKRGGVTITRVEIAREGLAKPRGRYVTLEMPSVSVLDAPCCRRKGRCWCWASETGGSRRMLSARARRRRF